MRRGGLADRRFHQSHFRGRSTARNLRAVDNGEYVDKMWIGEDEGSRTPGDTVERLLHLARELIALTWLVNLLHLDATLSSRLG